MPCACSVRHHNGSGRDPITRTCCSALAAYLRRTVFDIGFVRIIEIRAGKAIRFGNRDLIARIKFIIENFCKQIVYRPHVALSCNALKKQGLPHRAHNKPLRVEFLRDRYARRFRNIVLTDGNIFRIVRPCCVFVRHDREINARRKPDEIIKFARRGICLSRRVIGDHDRVSGLPVFIQHRIYFFIFRNENGIFRPVRRHGQICTSDF